MSAWNWRWLRERLLEKDWVTVLMLVSHMREFGKAGSTHWLDWRGPFDSRYSQ